MKKTLYIVSICILAFTLSSCSKTSNEEIRKKAIEDAPTFGELSEKGKVAKTSDYEITNERTNLHDGITRFNGATYDKGNIEYLGDIENTSDDTTGFLSELKCESNLGEIDKQYYYAIELEPNTIREFYGTFSFDENTTSATCEVTRLTYENSDLNL